MQKSISNAILFTRVSTNQDKSKRKQGIELEKKLCNKCKVKQSNKVK